jgi:hypothetical protein
MPYLERYNIITLSYYSCTLQSAFRKWKLLEFSKIKISWGNKKVESVPPRPWTVISSGGATYAEKIDLWQKVVELRRTNKAASPEVCLKALINTSGDYNRAVNLLGSKDFLFFAENKTSISDEMKAALNPSQLSCRRLDEKLKASQALNNSTKTLGSSARHGRALRAHRHLQESIRNSLELECETPDDHIDLRNTVNRCYYTVNYVGKNPGPKSLSK